MKPTRGLLHRIGSHIPILRFVHAAWQEARRPAPWEDVEDYEQYWLRRQAERRERPIGQERFELAVQWVEDGARVLDIGCGDGAFLAYLKEHRPNVRPTGADIAANAVARTRDRGIDAFQIDPQVPLRDRIQGPVDVVTLLQVIEHVPDAEALMRQVLALQPRKILIAIPNMGYLLHRIRLALGGRMPITGVLFHMKEHLRFWTVKDFQSWSRYLGLRVTRYVSCGDYQRQLARLSPSLFGARILYELVPLS